MFEEPIGNLLSKMSHYGDNLCCLLVIVVKLENMTKIWIDGFEANIPQRVGSGQVAIELLKNIEKLDHKNDYSVLLTSDPLEDLPKARDGFNYKKIFPNRFKTWI